MALIDHALFGYDDGHRLLAASGSLPGHDLNELLAATDTDPGTARSLTALPLPSSGRYALALTWPDPGAPRAGAVWAHALLLDETQVSDADPFALLGLLHPPPATRDLSAYHTPLSAPIESASAPTKVSPDALNTVATAAYGSRTGRCVVSSVDQAERAALSIWAVQWPQLRLRFAFRTRTRARPSDRYDVTIVVGTPAAEGRVRPNPVDARWLEVLTHQADDDQRADLVRWFQHYGPGEPARVPSMRALGRLWTLVQEGRLAEAASLVAGRHPTADTGAALKGDLFGPDAGTWGSDDPDALLALLRHASEAFDPVALDVEGRVAALARANRWRSVLEVVDGQEMVPIWRDCVINGLARHPDPPMVRAVAAWDPWPVLLLARSGLGHDPASWRDLPASTAEAITRQLDLDVGTTAALLSAGQAGAAVAAPTPVLRDALSTLDSATLTELAASATAPTLAEAAAPRELIVLAAAGAPIQPRRLLRAVLQKVTGDSHWRRAADRVIGEARGADVLALEQAGVRVPAEVLRQALEQQRHSADARWLASAVGALKRDPQALPVVFGPLHHALADDELPRSVWRTLDPLLPPASDPAQRLRLKLVQTIADEHWPKERVARALRDAGPHAREILRDADEDSGLLKLLKSVLKKLPI